MKILFLLVALANIGLFMWEFKTGAFEPVYKTDQVADDNQEQIRLASEVQEPSDAIAAMNFIAVPGTDAETRQGSAFPSVLDRQNGVFSEAVPALALTERAANNTAPEQNKSDAAMPLLPPPEAKNTPVQVSKETGGTVVEKAGADLKPAPAKPDAVEKMDGSKLAKPVVCYEAGPFADRRAYQLWLKRLNVDQEAIKPVSRQGEAISAYQVYYPAAETWAQSEANVQILKEQGIKDLLLLRKGEEQGEISLGVFTTEHRALLMQSQMLAKGIRAEIKPRYKPKLQHYALIADKGEVLARLNVLKKIYPDMTIKKLSQCSSD